MRRIGMPEIFEELEPLGVVLEYSFFENARESRHHDLQAIDAHLTHADQPAACLPDRTQWHLDNHGVSALLQISPRPLNYDQFLGSYCDPKDQMLILRGSGEVAGGTTLQDPRYDMIGERKIKSWGQSPPDLHDPGEYAYAFAQPPYGLRGSRAEAVRLFRKTTEILLPDWDDAVIHDWSGDDLSKVDGYFDSGMEWWGVFLFTIFQPSIERLIVISGSTTD